MVRFVFLLAFENSLTFTRGWIENLGPSKRQKTMMIVTSSCKVSIKAQSAWTGDHATEIAWICLANSLKSLPMVCFLIFLLVFASTLLDLLFGPQQSAIFNFQSLLIVILLIICTCAYIHAHFPAILDRNKTG
jgi:hypothetical protein